MTAGYSTTCRLRQEAPGEARRGRTIAHVDIQRPRGRLPHGQPAPVV